MIAVMGHSMRKICSSLRLALPHICSMLTPAYAGGHPHEPDHTVRYLPPEGAPLRDPMERAQVDADRAREGAGRERQNAHALVDQVKERADGLQRLAEIEARARPCQTEKENSEPCC